LNHTRARNPQFVPEPAPQCNRFVRTARNLNVSAQKNRGKPQRGFRLRFLGPPVTAGPNSEFEQGHEQKRESDLPGKNPHFPNRMGFVRGGQCPCDSIARVRWNENQLGRPGQRSGAHLRLSIISPSRVGTALRAVRLGKTNANLKRHVE